MLPFVRRGPLALVLLCAVVAAAAPAGAQAAPETPAPADPLAWARAQRAGRTASDSLARAAAQAAARADAALLAAAVASPALWGKAVDVPGDGAGLSNAMREALAARAARDAARRTQLGHRFYPEHEAPLMAEQAALVRRAYGHARRRTRAHFPSIERALARQGLPEDLKFVAVVESALDPLAISPAGAEGMWQFMPETQADYGLDSLTVRDPAASTAAALRYLRTLGRQFGGDWQLALAAYNCGPGRVQRLVREYRSETGEDATFWAIRDRLPRETQLYVPRWIALAEWLDG